MASVSVSRALREGGLWLLGALAVILLAALVTYDPGDPGYTDTGAGGGVTNAIGPVGAWVSNLFYFLFGKPSFLFPLMLAYAGWMLIRPRRDEPMTRTTMLLRTGGFVLTLAASAGLATLHFSSGRLPGTAGGVLGSLLGLNLAHALSFLGATLLLLALWLAGVSLFLGVSWLAIMDGIGRGVLNGFDAIRAGAASLRRHREGRRVKQARAEFVTQETKKKAQRPPPRIEPVILGTEPSERLHREKQVALFEPPPASELPPLSLLDDPPPKTDGYSEEVLEAMSRQVELKLADFGIEVEVVSVSPGPVVTRFELKPAPGVKVARISSLAKDLARALSAISVRVVEVIPGKSVVGLEIPNERRELVTLGEILKSKAYDSLGSPLTLALGKNISGQPMVADLARMPHLLIAGTTGSGKSVALNAMVLSLVYKATPEHVRLIMIDPKMLELSVYDEIPQLLTPVVTDMSEAANALRWCVGEMERRYQLMSALGVRNLAGYNRKVLEAKEAGKPIGDPLRDEDVPESEAPPLQALPYIVVVIDELADLMMMVGKKVEELIARLAQKARASGIHLILATQRPSVDVITGLIKANIPCRIAFQVSSKVDSRTILDQSGADTLLGHGDMLFLPPGTSVPTRVHGAFVDDQEVHRVVKHLKRAGPPTYLEDVLTAPQTPIPGLPGEGFGVFGDDDPEKDPLYDEAVQFVLETRRASISSVQRKLKVGYNRAARMVENMEAAGLVGPLQSNGAREVLAPPLVDED
jgi:S-DNA-T family DNA segregation ATPase FtsK/SpoIIIE